MDLFFYEKSTLFCECFVTFLFLKIDKKAKSLHCFSVKGEAFFALLAVCNAKTYRFLICKTIPIVMQ